MIEIKNKNEKKKKIKKQKKKKKNATKRPPSDLPTWELGPIRY